MRQFVAHGRPVISIFAAIFAGLLGLAAAAPAEAAAPRCMGLAATKVGTNGSNVILGTPGNDVIVARGGNDRVVGRGGTRPDLPGGGKRPSGGRAR